MDYGTVTILVLLLGLFFAIVFSLMANSPYVGLGIMVIVVLFTFLIPESEESEVKAKVVMIPPGANKLYAFFEGYDFTAFDGKDTLKVGTTKEAKTIKLNDTIRVKKMVIIDKITKKVREIKYSY